MRQLQTFPRQGYLFTFQPIAIGVSGIVFHGECLGSWKEHSGNHYGRGEILSPCYPEVLTEEGLLDSIGLKLTTEEKRFTEHMLVAIDTWYPKHAGLHPPGQLEQSG